MTFSFKLTENDFFSKVKEDVNKFYRVRQVELKIVVYILYIYILLIYILIKSFINF